MAESVPAAAAGPSQPLQAPRRHGCVAGPSERPGSNSVQPCPSHGNRRSSETVAAPTPAAEAEPGCDEAKITTVDAALPIFLRECPELADREDECRAALMHTYTADNTIQMLIEAAFEYIIAKLTGAEPEEEQQPDGNPVMEDLAPPAADPNDEEEAFRQETLAMRQAMHASELENTAHRKQQEKPMHQWSAKNFQEHFPHSILLPEIAKQCPGGGIDRMCTKESCCEVEKLLKNEQRSQRWYRTEKGLRGYWMKCAEPILEVGRGLMAIPSTSTQLHPRGGLPPVGPGSQTSQRKRKLRDIDATASMNFPRPDGSPNANRQHRKPAGLHRRPCSVTPAPAAMATGANGDAPLATAAASRGGPSTSRAADRACASPAASDCSALRRSKRVREGSVSREASVAPRVAGNSVEEPADTASRPAGHVGSSAAAEAPQATVTENAAGSTHVQEQPGENTAVVLNSSHLREPLEQGGVAANLGCDAGEGKENDGKPQAASAIGECDRERGGDKAKEADGASGVTEQGVDAKSSGRDATATTGQAQAGSRCGEGGGECVGAGSAAGDARGQCGSGEGAVEKGRSEGEVITELIAVLIELNRKFEEGVIAVACGPDAVAAFVPFRPVDTSRQEDDGECVRVSSGVTERRSKEGVQILEID